MAVRQYNKPYIDSSVLLGWINAEVCHGVDRKAVFQHIWDQGEKGAFKLYTSAWTIAEVHKQKGKPVTDSSAADALLKNFEVDFVEIIEMDRGIGEHAHLLCRQHAKEKLLPGDAIHLACAIAAGCDVMLVWDGPLTAVSRQDIRIEKPKITGPGTLALMP